jgi:high frequency lysogenization protein
MPYSITDRTLALAGLFQATRLVQQVANSGHADERDMETCLNSIFRVDVERAEDAFAGVDKLTTGLRILVEQLSGSAFASSNRQNDGKNHQQNHQQKKDLYITKYVAGVMVLEKRLKNNPAMLTTISDGIDRARQQIEHFSLLHENVIASLAHTYSQTISTLKPRIMVQGEHVYIANPNNANRIRALLLAAIRAAVLWRQCGGTRWQLLFQRGAIVTEAQRLMERHNLHQ